MLKYQHQFVENLIRDSGGPGSNPSLFHYYNLSQLFKAYKTCKAYGSSSSTHDLRSILTLYRLDESFANIHVHKLKKISIFSSKILSYDYFSDRGSNIDYSIIFGNYVEEHAKDLSFYGGLFAKNKPQILFL